MREGSVVLTPLPQQNGRLKNRPAIVLRRMPPFGDCLLCGVSTQLQHSVAGFEPCRLCKQRFKSNFIDSPWLSGCAACRSFAGCDWRSFR